jgi:hypothetical protein
MLNEGIVNGQIKIYVAWAEGAAVREAEILIPRGTSIGQLRESVPLRRGWAFGVACGRKATPCARGIGWKFISRSRLIQKNSAVVVRGRCDESDQGGTNPHGRSARYLQDSFITLRVRVRSAARVLSSSSLRSPASSVVLIGRPVSRSRI